MLTSPVEISAPTPKRRTKAGNFMGGRLAMKSRAWKVKCAAALRLFSGPTRALWKARGNHHVMLKISRLFLPVLLAALGPLLAAESTPNTRLLRFPATNGQQIVFSYAGQLYTVGMDGGTARRLT